MSGKIFFAALCFAALSLTALPVHAQWSSTERAEFSRDCLQACRDNPNVSSERKGQCVEYCSCVGEAAERAEPNYKVLNDDFLNGRDTPRVGQVKSAVPGCNTKAFR
jgi:hypothetical protein